MPWRHCVATALLADGMFSRGFDQCDGICRPPDAGSSARADRSEEHVEWRDAERQRERAIAVVREEPVVASAKVPARRNEDRLVTRAADLKERAGSDS